MAQRAWVRMYCGRDRQVRVATFQRSGADWQLVSVGRPEPSAGETAGALSVSGGFSLGPGYEGCPGCGSDSCVGCWRSAEPVYTCGNCAATGPVSGRIESLGALDLG